mmetsp:Transcript_11939/g.16154  ORF Transcript_11939/g.16154 Transcript_11939/m.16154 type:complete len:321 (+) Transcript_11939:1-963(+)
MAFPRNEVGCPCCGKRFFKHSLKIHLPQCEKKRSYIEIPCKWCDENFRISEMETHQAKCSQRPRKKIDKVENTTFLTMERQEENEVPQSSLDHRIACVVCSRKFDPDRISIHQKICKNLKSKTSAIPGPRKIDKPFPVGSAINFAKSNRQQYFSKRPKQEKRLSWQEKSRVTRTLIREAKRMHQQQVKGVPLTEIQPSAQAEAAYESLTADFVACPHCNRTFAPETATRHIPRCATTMNKPRAPPSYRSISFSQQKKNNGSSSKPLPPTHCDKSKRGQQQLYEERGRNLPITKAIIKQQHLPRREPIVVPFSSSQNNRRR